MEAGAANPPKKTNEKPTKTAKPKKCAHEPWLDTAIDLSKVLTTDDKGVLHVAGKPLPNGQLVQLKADAQVIEKLPMWGILIETLRQYAVSTGFNRSQDFESVKVAKAMLLILDGQKGWTQTIASASADKADVSQHR